MGPTLEQVCCASLPLPSLAVLADLRRAAGIRVTLTVDRAWVRWEIGSESVLRRVLPVPGVELFERRGGHWYRPGHHLPAFAVPLGEGDDEGLVLASALFPDKVRVLSPEGSPAAPARLALVRDDRARTASALECGLDALARWAETATTAQLAAVSAARADDTILLMGRRLPPLAGAERLWGGRVLAPLGFRPEPDLHESALRTMLRVDDDAIVWLRAEGVELVAAEAFRTLTRAGIRLAGGSRP